jgi:hypothetical protein
MRAIMGPDLRCPICGRPQHGVVLRSGDAWLTCWHQRCTATLWAVRLPALAPTAQDVAEHVGERIASCLLLTYSPAPVIVIEVPAAVRTTLTTASRLAVVARLTTVLVGAAPMTAAVGPQMSKEAA